MINVSGAFKQRLYADKRNYLEYIKITLLDGAILELNNQHIWQGSLSFEEAVSADNEFQIGAAIVGKCDFTINNIYGTFDEFDFTGATVLVKIGLVVGETRETTTGETGETSEGETGQTEEWINKGVYTVDTADYNDTYIKISCLDNMSKLDKKFVSTLAPSFPIHAGDLLDNIFTYCGVSYNLTAFSYGSTDIYSLGDSETMTCRDVISWIAQIFGYYARCNPSGALELKWFNRQGLEASMTGLDGGIFDDESQSTYVSGETADGGSFNPWDTGDVVSGGDFTEWANDIHYFSSTFSHSVSVDDVVITGVRILVKTGGTGGSEIATHMKGTTGYVVEISNNPIITESNVTAILNRLYSKLSGLAFRKANLSIPSDPSIEAGDVGVYFDKKGNHHPILISRVTFSPGESQTIVSSAQTPARNSSERYGAETKSYVEMRKSVEAEKTAREQAIAALQSAITNAGGLYASTVTDQSTGAVTYYLHNKPNRNESDIRIMFSDAGITVTSNGTAQTPTWYGLQVNGDMLINLLSATGIDADWINTGSLTVGGTGSMANGSINILDSSGTLIGKWNKDGIVINKGSININGNFGVDQYGNAFANAISIGSFFVLYAVEEDPDTGWSWIYDRLVAGDKVAQSVDSQEDKIGVLLDPKGRLELTRRGTYASNADYVQLLFNDSGSVSGTSHKLTALELWYGKTTANTSKKIDLCATSSAFKVYRKQYDDYPIEFGWDGKARFDGVLTVNDGMVATGTATLGGLSVSDGISVGGVNQSTFRDVQVNGNAYVTGTKTRLVSTEDYSERQLFAYETSTPTFGDIGEGVIGEDGQCYVAIDPVFAETVTLSQYQVFLQKYGNGDAYVSERHSNYFVVQGTVGLGFGWEIKAKQRDYELYRLDKKADRININSEEYGDLAIEHIEQINREREAL